jgi:hypothetical protein
VSIKIFCLFAIRWIQTLFRPASCNPTWFDRRCSQASSRKLNCHMFAAIDYWVPLEFERSRKIKSILKREILFVDIRVSMRIPLDGGVCFAMSNWSINILKAIVVFNVKVARIGKLARCLFSFNYFFRLFSHFNDWVSYRHLMINESTMCADD